MMMVVMTMMVTGKSWCRWCVLPSAAVIRCPPGLHPSLSFDQRTQLEPNLNDEGYMCPCQKGVVKRTNHRGLQTSSIKSSTLREVTLTEKPFCVILSIPPAPHQILLIACWNASLSRRLSIYCHLFSFVYFTCILSCKVLIIKANYTFSMSWGSGCLNLKFHSNDFLCCMLKPRLDCSRPH